MVGVVVGVGVAVAVVVGVVVAVAVAVAVVVVVVVVVAVGVAVGVGVVVAVATINIHEPLDQNAPDAEGDCPFCKGRYEARGDVVTHTRPACGRFPPMTAGSYMDAVVKRCAFKPSRKITWSDESQGTVHGDPLTVCLGHRKGVKLALRGRFYLDEREGIEGENRVTGLAIGWRRLAVLTHTTESGSRMFEIVPGSERDEIHLAEFHVRGKFSIERRINNTKRAREEWKAFGEGSK